jgi:hypothetical protein
VERGGPLWSPAPVPDGGQSQSEVAEAGHTVPQTASIKAHSAHHPPDGVPIHSPLAPTDDSAFCLSPWLLHPLT